MGRTPDCGGGFYNRSDPVIDLSIFDKETMGGDNVQSWTHDIRQQICPGFVATPMTDWTGLLPDEMIQPEDVSELVRALLRLSPRARVPSIVIERANLGD